MYTNSLPNSPYRRIAPITSPQTPTSDTFLTPAKPRTLSPLTPSKLNGADLSVTLSELRNQLQSKELHYIQRIKELEEDIKLVSEKYNELIADPEHQNFLSVIDQLQIKISQQHDNLKMRDDRIEDLKRLVDDQGTRIENLEAKLKDQTLIVIQKYEEFLSSSKTYAKAISEKDKIIENLTDRLTTIMRHKEDSDRVAQSEIEQLKLQLKIKDRQIEGLSVQYETSKVEYDESLHYFEEMTHSSQRNFDTLSKRMNEQMEEILAKDKQVDELNSRVKQLLSQAYNVKTTYEDSIQALNVEVMSKSKQITMFQSQIEVLKIEAAQKQAEFEHALNQERLKLDVRKVEGLERERNELKDENKSLYEKLKERETQSQLMAVKVDSVELQKENLAKQLEDLRREVSQLREELNQKDELLVSYHQNNAQLQSDLGSLRQSVHELKHTPAAHHIVEASPSRHVPEDSIVEAVSPKATDVIMDRLIDSQSEVGTSPGVAPMSPVVESPSEQHSRADVLTPLEETTREDVVAAETAPSPRTGSEDLAKPTEISVEGNPSTNGTHATPFGDATVANEQPITENANGALATSRSDDENGVSESSSEESMSSEEESNKISKDSGAQSTTTSASSATGAASKSVSDQKLIPREVKAPAPKSTEKNITKKPSKLWGILILVVWLLVSFMMLVVVKPDLVSSTLGVQVPNDIGSNMYNTVYNYVTSYL